MSIAFLVPEIQSAIVRLLSTPPTNVKHMELLTILSETFANSWICFYQEVLPKLWFVSCLLIVGDRHWQIVAAAFEKAKSANSLSFAW